MRRRAFIAALTGAAAFAPLAARAQQQGRTYRLGALVPSGRQTPPIVANLKTAKAIGHEIPAGLVLRADKLIE